jgi:hypothetical protein
VLTIRLIEIVVRYDEDGDGDGWIPTPVDEGVKAARRSTGAR